MVLIPPQPLADPTLEAIDAALVAANARQTPRTYLGMSSIGHPCGRKLWYDYHRPIPPSFDAATVRRFEDGHRGEDLMADRLRMVPGVTLQTIDPDTGRQWAYSDHNGRFGGHADGRIIGILQAPRTWHIWEHKCVGEDKFNKLNELKRSRGEKHALREWDAIYYSQAVLYMHYSGITRHYLTCDTPGGRASTSVRTDADPVHASELIDKALRILNARAPLARVSNDPAWWQCRFCNRAGECHQ
jgi:hypothetical protein